MIIWIASYPKSGNTLLRIMLSNLFFTSNGIGDINKIQTLIPTLETTGRLDIIKNLNPSDFLQLNNLNILYKYFQTLQLKENLKIKGDFLFLKTHNALVSYFNYPFTTENNTVGYIYIVRDPRDVVISWSKHSNIDLDESIDFMCKDTSYINWLHSKNTLVPKEMEIKTLLLNWEQHVLSWSKQGLNVPKLILKYEDVVYKKKDTLIKIVNFFNKKFGFNFANIDEKIENIIKETNFKNLQQKENKEGFKDAVNDKFFRSGQKNQWKNILNDRQIKLIEEKFKNTMLKYGYVLNFN